MTLSQAELEATAATLARRPGHEQVRVRICDILERHFEVGYDAVDHERRIEHVGRIDALFGSTVFEFKRDLRREAEDAERQLHRYLIDRESATGRRYAGIATDGNDFRAYEIRSDRLCQIGAYRVEATNANGLLVWLESVIGIGADLEPTAETIRRELGKESAAFARATGVLEAAWSRLATDSEAALKRRLWSELITAVYGRSQDSDELWFQHTFLTIIAKAFAHAVLRVTPDDAEDLLQGRQFRDLAIGGLIEGDFFDWVLKDEEAADLVMRLDRHVRRFRIDRVELDVLKIVYESLIDPAQRHDLGEYYTPDWLADWICARHVDAPASQKVLDPACGSGSFLFHAVRHHVAAARAEGVPEGELAQSAAAHVFGLDVHPVAVLVARVTYLLALGADLLERRTTAVDVPVYLGDALQWSVRGGDLFEETLEIHVPESGGHGEAVLRFPVAVCRDPGVFDDIIRLMLEDGDAGRPTQAFVEQLSQDDRIAAADRAVLADAYATLARLQAEGRNH
ncbi:MAG: N-6 DNA methylase, partial [Alphaproteobacteria bacterium]|nr:N-6 DNA methylase [Alphaproteobacteria bacterium]